MKSVMAHQFSQVPKAEIPRSTFDRTHGYKTTFDAGYLIPFLIDEALPGDTFNVRATIFSRLATPIFPIMDNMFMDTHFFAIPIRLLWDNWQKFNGEQRNPGDSTSFVVPQMVSPAGGYALASLSDYFGIPTGIAGIEHSSLWHRAYNLVFNEWFRDENLVNSVPTPTNDGPDVYTDFVLKRRGKRHDYFTACLPFPQKGVAINMPLGGTAVVKGDGQPIYMHGQTTTTDRHVAMGSAGTTMLWNVAASANEQARFGQVTTNLNTGLVADLSATTGTATINSLRQAFQLQRMLERDARGGTRYVELLKAHFGVTSPDQRLQRPEYLGGGSSPINITPVQQQSSTDATSPQGHLAGFGVSASNNHAFTKSFTEHCIILGLVSVRADLTYQQGLDRMFSRSTRFDFYWPALSHIGEQAVLRKEIYSDGVDANDNTVFGYQERYAEYRYKPSKITGQFRSTAAAPLDAWHLSQKFTGPPVLDATFISEDPPIDRVIAVPAEPHFLFDSYITMHCARPMPIYGVPGLIDHF